MITYARSFMNEIGFDAEAIYHFGDYGFTSAYQEEYMTGELNGSKFVCLASVGTGFNDIGWTETRTPLATVEEFENVTGKLKGKIEYLYLHLMGEPTVHPQLKELLNIAFPSGF